MNPNPVAPKRLTGRRHTQGLTGQRGDARPRLDRAGRGEVSSRHTQNSTQFKPYELFMPGTFPFIFPAHGCPRVTETVKSKTTAKRGPLYLLPVECGQNICWFWAEAFPMHGGGWWLMLTPWDSGSHSLSSSGSPGVLGKPLTAGPQLWSSRFSRLWGEPKNGHFSELPSWCWCWSSKSEAWGTRYP